jgi:hypothetical protein
VLVSRWVYDTAVYGGLVAVVASAWYAIRHRERRVEPKIPQATAGRSLRRYVARIAPVIVLIALIGAEWALLAHAHDAIIIDPESSTHRAIYVGIEHERLMRGSENTVLFNRAHHVIKIYWAQSGDFQIYCEIGGDSVTPIPAIDYIGPDKPMPAEPTDASGMRTWLTWD